MPIIASMKQNAATTNDTEITTIQAERFDQCVSELSNDAQKYFAAQVARVSEQLGRGAGTKSAKALLYQLMFFAERKNITTATLLTR